MVNMTLAIQDRTHRVMKRHPEIKWTEVARQAIEKKAIQVEMEKDPIRKYSMKRLFEEGDEAEDIFEF